LCFFYLASCNSKEEKDILKIIPNKNKINHSLFSAISNDDKILVSIHQDKFNFNNYLYIWRLDSGVFQVEVPINDSAKSVFFTENNNIMIVLENDNMYEIDEYGKPIQGRLFTEEEAKRNNIQPLNSKDKKVISVKQTGEIQLYEIITNKLIASFYVYDRIEEKDWDIPWVIITPDGFYNSSYNADGYIRVQYGDKESDDIGQFKNIFLQEGIVINRLKGIEDDHQLISMLMEKSKLIPPLIVINNISINNSGQAIFNVTVSDIFEFYIDNIQIIINGRLLGEDELDKVDIKTKNVNYKIQNTKINIQNQVYKIDFIIELTLDNGSNIIQILAENKSGSGKNIVKREIHNNYEDARKQNLWILAIGIDNYENMPPLSFSVKNTYDIIDMFKEQEGERYAKVNYRIIADDNKNTVFPTKENIIKNVNEYFNYATPNDVLILYISGHGESALNNYYFLPVNYRAKNYSTAVSLNELNVFYERPGRKIMILDFCFSGGVKDINITDIFRNQSTAILASSRRDQQSMEIEYYESIFTKELIYGIKEGTEALNNEVKLIDLEKYLKSIVPHKTSQNQIPSIFIPDGFSRFIITYR